MHRGVTLFAAIGLVLLSVDGVWSQETPINACSALIDVQSNDLTGGHSVLARALSATTFRTDSSSAFLRAAGTPLAFCADSLPFLRSWLTGRVEPARVSIAPATLLTQSNSNYPRERNNGVLWSGVGLNASLNAGLLLRAGVVSLGFAPVLALQTNGNFADPRSIAADRSVFANPDHVGIDWPKRMGRGSFTTIDPGQTYVRADYRGVSAALSNENLWLGPAQMFPMLLSNTAAGFPHLRVGTRYPLRLGPLNVEATAFWGSLRESEYFDSIPSNDSHMFGGTTLTLSPTFLPGFHLGLARVYHDNEPVGADNVGFYLSLLGRPPFIDHDAGDRGNGLSAVFLRWVHPASGFEVYGEAMVEESADDLLAFLRQPDHTRAYSFGLQKVFASPQRVWRVYAESTVLGQSSTVLSGTGFYSTYTNTRVPQGHTHDGQLLGAAIGPGSNAMLIGADAFSGSGRMGFLVEYVRYDEDTYYRTFARRFGESRHDAEVTGEARYMRFAGPVELEGVLRISHRYDRDFYQMRIDNDRQNEVNWGTELRVTWRRPPVDD